MKQKSAGVEEEVRLSDIFYTFHTSYVLDAHS